MSVSLLLRYREADRSGVDATERPLVTPSSQEEGAQPPHPHALQDHAGKLQGQWRGSKKPGERVDGSLHCGFHGKDKARQSKQGWDGLAESFQQVLGSGGCL